MQERQTYQELIRDAEWRIGSYIASGGNSEDEYVKDQVQKIQTWTDKLVDLERR